MDPKIDKSNMRRMILDFPSQFRIGLEAAKEVKVPGSFDAILICGMGGSALAGDILKMWLNAYKIGVPLCVHRSYDLPHQAEEKNLIVVVSYSGNTEEALYSYWRAIKEKLSTIAITTGGKLGELCKKEKIPWVKIPLTNIPPRLAIGCQFGALMQILVNCKIIRNSLKNILVLEKNLKPDILEIQGKKIAKKLKGKFPIIYASDRLKSLARIWKIKFNENSKIPAFYNYFPELNHNEMVGYTKIKNNFHVIILRDPADFSRIRKRMALTAKIIKRKGVPVSFIDVTGKDILYKIFSNVLLAEWVSYYLALHQGVDPLPVEMIEEFKKKMEVI